MIRKSLPLDLIRGWKPVFRKDHAPLIKSAATASDMGSVCKLPPYLIAWYACLPSIWSMGTGGLLDGCETNDWDGTVSGRSHRRRHWRRYGQRRRGDRDRCRGRCRARHGSQYLRESQNPVVNQTGLD